MNSEDTQTENGASDAAPNVAAADWPAKDWPAKDWLAGLDAEARALVALKGWREPGDALKSYRHLERLVGADKLVLPGEGASPEAWAEIWNKLGRPQSPAGYEFQPPADMPYDPKAADWFRQQAHALGLTAQQARGLHDAYLANFGAASPSAEKPADTTTDETPDADLRRTWGRNYQANMSAAKRAFAAFLDGESAFDDLSEAFGEMPLMNLLARIGRVLGEDSITARDSFAGFGPRSRDAALAEIQRLQREVLANPRHPYVSKMHPEHDAIVRRMEALFQTAYGG